MIKKYYFGHSELKLIKMLNISASSYKKSLFLILFLCLLSISMAGQQDKFTFDELTVIADSLFEQEDFEKSLEFYEKALKAEKEKLRPDVAKLIKGLGNVGYMHYRNTNYDKGATYFSESIAKCRLVNDSVELSINLANLSQCILYLGEFDKALLFMTEALEIEKRLGNEQGQSINLNAIGKIYERWGMYHAAIEFYNQALSIERKNDNQRAIAVRLSSIGSAYAALRDFPNALKYQQEALEIDKQLGNREQTGIRMQRIGQIYQEMRDYAEAKKYLDNALRIFRELSLKNPEASVLLHLAQNERFTNNNASAIRLYKESLELAEELKVSPLILEINKELAEVLRDEGNYRQAFYHLYASASLRDSLFNIETLRQISEFREKYEAEKKEKENILLMQENELRRRAHRFSMAIIAVLVIVTLLLLWAFALKRKSLQQSRELFIKESELSKLNIEAMERQNQHLQELLFAEEQIRKLQLKSIEQKNHELTSSAMLIANKNDIFEKLKKLAEQIKTNRVDESVEKAKEIISEIDRQTDLENQWEQFKIHFESIHKTFFDNLRGINSCLTRTDFQICAYIKLNLSTKDISRVMNITPESVNTHRYRLRKRLNLPAETTLDAFIHQI